MLLVWSRASAGPLGSRAVPVKELLLEAARARPALLPPGGPHQVQDRLVYLLLAEVAAQAVGRVRARVRCRLGAHQQPRSPASSIFTCQSAFKVGSGAYLMQLETLGR